jgi:hypothetical protein
MATLFTPFVNLFPCGPVLSHLRSDWKEEGPLQTTYLAAFSIFYHTFLSNTVKIAVLSPISKMDDMSHNSILRLYVIT